MKVKKQPLNLSVKNKDKINSIAKLSNMTASEYLETKVDEDFANKFNYEKFVEFKELINCELTGFLKGSSDVESLKFIFNAINNNEVLLEQAFVLSKSNIK